MSLVDNLVGLENRLEGVKIGDIILLENTTNSNIEPKGVVDIDYGRFTNVVGYVIDYGSKKIKLSTTDPYSDKPYDWGFLPWMKIINNSRPKTYELKDFDKYEILKKHK